MSVLQLQPRSLSGCRSVSTGLDWLDQKTKGRTASISTRDDARTAWSRLDTSSHPHITLITRLYCCPSRSHPHVSRREFRARGLPATTVWHFTGLPPSPQHNLLSRNQNLARTPSRGIPVQKGHAACPHGPHDFQTRGWKRHPKGQHDFIGPT